MRNKLLCLILIGVLGFSCAKSVSAFSRIEQLKLVKNVIEYVRRDNPIIIYNGRHYEARPKLQYVFGFLVLNYKSESVEDFIKKWCYRSRKGNLIYIVLNGKRELAQDVLLRYIKESRDNNEDSGY